jgi:hypothetical protein
LKPYLLQKEFHLCSNWWVIDIACYDKYTEYIPQDITATIANTTDKMILFDEIQSNIL